MATAAILTCVLFSTGSTSLCLPPSKPSSPTTPGALQGASILFQTNRLAQERIKLQYVSIMERQKHMERTSEDYKRLDCLFYTLIKEEDRLRHEMTILAAALSPAAAGPEPRFRGSDTSRLSSHTNHAMGYSEARQNTTQRLG